MSKYKIINMIPADPGWIARRVPHLWRLDEGHDIEETPVVVWLLVEWTDGEREVVPGVLDDGNLLPRVVPFAEWSDGAPWDELVRPGAQGQTGKQVAAFVASLAPRYIAEARDLRNAFVNAELDAQFACGGCDGGLWRRVEELDGIFGDEIEHVVDFGGSANCQLRHAVERIEWVQGAVRCPT